MDKAQVAITIGEAAAAGSRQHEIKIEMDTSNVDPDQALMTALDLAYEQARKKIRPFKRT
jgi:hypothetical protein